MKCEYCNFSCENEEEFSRHLKRIDCIESKNYTFSCNYCPFIGRTYKTLKNHSCLKLYYKSNELQELRVLHQKSFPTRIQTVAQLEWQRKEQCKDDENISLYSKWLTSPELPIISSKNILKVEKLPWHLFMEYTINTKIDFRLYFKLLFAKCDAAYWPFFKTNFLDMFEHEKCPIQKQTDGNFCVQLTRDPIHKIYDLNYTNWYWAKISVNDLKLFLNKKWCQTQYKSIISVLESTTDSNAWWLPNVKAFLEYWIHLDVHSLPLKTTNNQEPVVEKFEYNKDSLDFEHCLRSYSRRREHIEKLLK